ncbi:probable iron binding protein from the HesB_IscA_SufA family [Sulfuriferula multivorans]|uniref:Putative iron-sulfur cluster insertion protein ErpA n=1 Tax=Sulfuriferula multivorans TaxID=1559896 RepID=A0A401JC82_9PROT|nr:iron-sulfur cluster insertion protein ErpA [Sulfuriferula multivorans]GBL45174.1 probable iron binding protein from the HesB_IscA_SufA family [Sulfuriferula multivorans]
METQTLSPVVEMPVPSPIVFTEAAANKVKEIIADEGNTALKLRVSVTGGGCSGFQYGFSFDENSAEDDTVMEKCGVSLLIDPMSFQYLMGAVIDYQESLEGARFVINNPNAASTCGCGSSFSV